MTDDVSQYQYNPIFDDREPKALLREPKLAEVADRATPEDYVFDEEIRIAVNLALATGRPLLVSGPSGSGKSSLAHAVAKLAGWSYCERAITSRVQARDLLYEIDHLKRLQDAQQSRLKGDERPYIIPGPLFWAFDPEGARSILSDTGRAKITPPGIKKHKTRCVVLLDEIDKADPDVPNDLLVPFGQLSFEIAEVGHTIACKANTIPLLVLTTNGERDLPPAFLRRCVELHIEGVRNTSAGRAKLFSIVRKHRLAADEKQLGQLADAFFAAPRPERFEPNAAEFLDLVRAWQQLQLESDAPNPTLEAILNAIVRSRSDLM